MPFVNLKNVKEELTDCGDKIIQNWCRRTDRNSQICSKNQKKSKIGPYVALTALCVSKLFFKMSSTTIGYLLYRE